MTRSLLLPTRRGFLRGVAAALAAPALARTASASQRRNPAFFVLGDWGARGAPGQRQVTAAMEQTARRAPPDFIISVGDNFYNDGVRSTDDGQWLSSFEEIYRDQALRCPWFPVLGNHDHHGNVGAELSYSAIDPRWQMPAAFYRKTEVLADGSAADFIFLDTTPIAEPRADGFPDRHQLGWLERELAASRARWKIVAGHHPVFSGGFHGNNVRMIEHVKPLLDRYGVAAYLAGHDHDLEHVAVDGVHYLTSGAGANARPVRASAATRFAAARLGFLSARLDSESLRIDFVGIDSRSMYAARIALPS